MAFVLFWLQQHIFLFRHQNHVFLPASTTWLLFCSGINNKDNLSMKYSAATQEPSHARVTSVKSTTSLGDWVTGSDKKEEKFVLSIHLRMGSSRIDTIWPLYDHTFFPFFLSLCFLKNIVLKLNQFLFLEKKILCFNVKTNAQKKNLFFNTFVEFFTNIDKLFVPWCVNKNTTKYFLKHNLCICFKIH